MSRSRRAELAGEAAGITKITTHTFRLTYRSLAGAAGIESATIKDLMRQANISTSMDVYGAPVDSAMRAAQSKILKTLIDG